MNFIGIKGMDMKKRFLRPLSFVGKSLAWSLLLYMVCMFIFNRDEMSAGFKKYRQGQIAETQKTEQRDPSANIPQISTEKHSFVYAAGRMVLEELVKTITSFRK
jgi:hypothetical protein